VDITWFGHACFRIREDGVTIVADPYSKEIGYALPRVRADVITLSHAHEGHSYAQGTRGRPRVLRSPGEYEVGGVFMTAVPTFHDDLAGRERGQNLGFLYDFQDLTACHLGDLGHGLNQAQLEALDGVNVLMIPVGGGATLSPSAAVELVAEIEPNIVIPMHYRLPGLARDLAPVSRFLKAMGVSPPAPQPSLRVRPGGLSEETQVVLLEPRGVPIEG
jgi:L-ascorbate metabolism protein UlaG (beta-lactamase superfamily)